MPRRSPDVIELSKTEREELAARVRRYTSPYRDVIRAKIVLLAAGGLANDAIGGRRDTPRQVVSKWRQRFYHGSIIRPRGGSSRRAASPLFPPASSSRSRLSRVSCRGGVWCRWPAGRCRSADARWSRKASWRRSAAPRCGAGSARMRCDRGAIAVGSSPAIPNSPSRPAGSWISTSAAGKAFRSGLGSTCSAPTKRRASRPGVGVTRRSRQRQVDRGGSRTSTLGPAPGRISLLGTCIAPGCSAAAKPRPASRRSIGSSPK